MADRSSRGRCITSRVREAGRTFDADAAGHSMTRDLAMALEGDTGGPGGVDTELLVRGHEDGAAPRDFDLDDFRSQLSRIDSRGAGDDHFERFNLARQLDVRGTRGSQLERLIVEVREPLTLTAANFDACHLVPLVHLHRLCGARPSSSARTVEFPGATAGKGHEYTK